MSEALTKPNEISSRQRHYEVIYIITPVVNDADAKAILEKNIATLQQFNGTVLRQDDWGKKKMAHIIDKHLMGSYHYFRFVSSAQALKEVERNLKLDARVIRFHTVSLSGVLSAEEIAQLVERAPREASAAPSVRQIEDDGEAASYANA